MKMLFFLTTCLIAWASSPAFAQAERPAAVVARFYYQGIGTLHLAVTHGAGQTEDTVLKGSGGQDQLFAEAYQQVLARLYQEGYTLRGTINTERVFSVTLLFEKRQ